MSLGEQIETIITSMTNNNIPSEIVKINKSYQNNTCDIICSKGNYKNVKCSGLAVTGGKGLLTFMEGKQDKPFVILFEDANNTIQSLGLGRFTISNDGDLYLELPNNTPNNFSINEDMDLIVEITDGLTNDYSINNDGDIIYDRWDF